MSKLMLNLGAQPNTHTLMKLNTIESDLKLHLAHTLMKLNTIESDLKLHLAKKGNHTHTKEPSQIVKLSSIHVSE